MAAKTSGARNLHLLTRGQSLDFFILFSSIASVIGSSGQGNYAAANAFLDALAHHRRSLGLPATSINWGPWEDAGMAARTSAADRGRWAALGIQSIPPDRALSLLSRLLLNPRAQVVAVPIAWPEFFKAIPPELAPAILREIGRSVAGGEDGRGPQARPVFLDELLRAPPRRRRALLLDHVVSQVRKALGLTAADAIDPQQGLSSLGMDSLMAVELRSRLQTSLGCSLPATMAFEYPNIAAIVDFVAKEVLPGEKPTAAEDRAASAPAAPAEAGTAPVPASPHLDDLSETELAGLLESKLSSLGRKS
jgi:acyl carrier protein